jgi:hypothetical protein
MDLSQYIVAAGALIGFVNGVRLLQSKEYWAFMYFVIAVAGGGVLGYFHWFTLPDAQTGILVGLSSSGVYRIGQVVSGK